MYTARLIRRSWVEIDLRQMKKNLDIFREQLPSDMKIMAVVKADAYGHGDVRVASELNQMGISLFAVSNIDEAILLREAGVRGEVLVLGYTPVELAGELLKYDITQTLLSATYAENLLAYSSQIKCQFAIDTGMNRIGLSSKDSEACAAVIRSFAPRCCLTGVFTHLFAADGTSEKDVSASHEQLSLFHGVVSLLTDLDLPYIHCLNSAGGLFYHEACRFTNTVRLGIVLYGLKPDIQNQLPYGIKPIMTWKTVVSLVKNIDTGDTVGYGRMFCAASPMKIATLSVGYADGYSRRLSNSWFVIIKGKKVPIIGRVCMDQIMVDVTALDDVCEGDEVILLGDGLSADEMASAIDTIGYEVICGISKRVARAYKK